MYSLKRRKTARLLVILGIFLCCLGLGWSLAAWSLEPIPERFTAGRETYLESCKGCHIAIPPQVMPTETWRKLLEKPQNHYSTSVDLLSLSQVLIWDYLRAYSRPLYKDEPLPLYLEQSRYFKALHPRVPLPQPLTEKTCANCHLNANSFDFRSLTPQWDNSP